MTLSLYLKLQVDSGEDMELFERLKLQDYSVEDMELFERLSLLRATFSLRISSSYLSISCHHTQCPPTHLFSSRLSL